MKRGRLIWFLGFFIVLSILPFFSALSENYCVEASVTEISPSSIGVGEEFTIGIQIENCGSSIPEFVSFELINPPTDIMIKEPLVINISKLYYGNSERFITYHMRTANNAHPGTHIINTRLSYGNKNSYSTKSDSISFEVTGNEAELNIASIKTKPVLPIEKDTVELTLRIENTGEGVAKAIKVYVDHPFQGVKQAFIGALNPNEDGPAIFNFIVDKPGDFEFPVIVSYVDDFGKKEVKTDIEISVLKKESNLAALFASIIILVLIGWAFFHFIRKGKSKDKIIHQLLKGNHHSGKGGK